MNRNNDHNNARKNHYADFDEFGNKRDDSRRNRQEDSWINQMSRAGYRSAGQDQKEERDRFNQGSRGSGNYNHPNFGARAYGDMSGGTPYGEGGSRYGGGSAYGHSNYGFEGEHGPRNDRGSRNQSNQVRYGYGNYTDYNSRNYGSYGGSNYSGNMNSGRDTSYGGDTGYGNTGRENTGYDRGFSNFGRTGYGSTGYNNRDMDRERGAYGNFDRSHGSGQDLNNNPRGRESQDAYDRMRRERNSKW